MFGAVKSASIKVISLPASFKRVARLIAIVVLPVPPFDEAITINLVIFLKAL